YSLLSTNDWNISLFGNLSLNRNLVTNLEGTETIDLTTQSVSSRAIEGYPLGVLYGTGSQTNPDGSFILDANGFPQITSSPIILGDPNPDWRGVLGTKVNYKALTLNVLFEHSQGGDFAPRTLWVLRRFGTTQETANRITLTKDMVNYDGNVIPAGTTVRGNIGNFGGGDVLLDETWYRHGIGGGLGDNQAYNFSIFDATFSRIRELSLSYMLNSDEFRRRTKLSSVVISLTGRNLFMIDKIEGVDPEINQMGDANGYGLDYFTNPSTRSFLFSISINY
ncbi:MAG: SusC/RagA family TonB-linked outer membrane protein, partial [Cyclobacteriaceae bacterium]|nr:SusC/RagA family TonB-linked outer membrane protein [Cyclobacteriaceae bacterium]